MRSCLKYIDSLIFASSPEQAFTPMGTVEVCTPLGSALCNASAPLYPNCLISNTPHCSDSHGQQRYKKQSKAKQKHTYTPPLPPSQEEIPHSPCTGFSLCHQIPLQLPVAQFTQAPRQPGAASCLLSAQLHAAAHCPSKHRPAAPAPQSACSAGIQFFPLIGMQPKSFKISPKDVFKLVSNMISHCCARISASLQLFLFLGL